MDFPTDFDGTYMEEQCSIALHEQVLGQHMISANLNRKNRYDLKNYEQLLKDHYLRGTAHPDDANLPLNRWNETE